MAFKATYRLVMVIAIFLVESVTVVASELVQPDPSIAAGEVVAIQMMGLKHNDLDERDFGIRQTWAFAHPQNRQLTGPLPRFALMLKSPSYAMLLNHRRHSIAPAATPSGRTETGDEWRKFDVLVETEQATIFHFSWIVQKVRVGRFEDCWMTVGVSPPRKAGQAG
jgi:hypothetical protein